MKRTTILAAMLLASLASTALQARAQHEGHGGDSAAVVGVIAKYHEAMASGDSASALALLADDAVILESVGSARSKHHSHTSAAPHAPKVGGGHRDHREHSRADRVECRRQSLGRVASS